MPARGGGPPNNGQRLSWLIGPASSMAGLAQTAQQWSVRAARSVCGWYHCTPLGGVRKVRTQEKMYIYLYRLGDDGSENLSGSLSRVLTAAATRFRVLAATQQPDSGYQCLPAHHTGGARGGSE